MVAGATSTLLGDVVKSLDVIVKRLEVLENRQMWSVVQDVVPSTSQQVDLHAHVRSSAVHDDLSESTTFSADVNVVQQYTCTYLTAFIMTLLVLASQLKLVVLAKKSITGIHIEG